MIGIIFHTAAKETKLNNYIDSFSIENSFLLKNLVIMRNNITFLQCKKN